MQAMPQEVDPLRQAMDAVAAMVARSDQRHWAAVLEGLARRLEREPAAVARAVLALFEGPGAWNRVVTEGDWALDSIVLTTDGVARDRPGVSWEEVLAYPRLRHAMYRAALALWLARGEHAPLPRGEGAPEKLADYGWGCEIWARGGRFHARYDRGGHQAAWRVDEISEDEARQGLLGGKHFSFLLIAIEARLKASGIDPYEGSPHPLPAP
ncbi:hypothetical protein [Roseomonas elaeocarpi]|uniref:Uncharacterized protein n=1 Tax=Roseomonas elaeocarpi TaxID=907779 RepID=A0ABV6JNG5_9PROT